MTSPIPEGHSTLAPNIVVQGGQEALGFYQRAFGGEVVLRLTWATSSCTASCRSATRS